MLDKSKWWSYLTESKTPIFMAFFSALSLAFSFLNNSLIAKELGSEAFGQYNFLSSLILLLGMSASFGLDTYSFSLFNQKDKPFSKSYFLIFSLGFSFVLAIFLSLSASLAIELFFKHPLFEFSTYIWLTLGILTQTILVFGMAWLRIFGKVLMAHALSNTLRVVLQSLLILSVLHFTNGLKHLNWGFACYSISFAIVLIPMAIQLKKVYPFDKIIKDTQNSALWLKKSSYVFIYELTYNFYQYVDVFILEFLDKGHEMGVYLMARKLSLFASLFTSLMGANNQGIMSKLNFEGQMSALQNFIRRQCRISLMATTFFTISIVILSTFYLEWLGKDFIEASMPLLILLTGEILISTFGNASLFLPVSGMEKKGKIGVWVAIGIQITLTPLFWQEWGAIAMAFIVVLANLCKYLITNWVISKEKKIRFWIF